MSIAERLREVRKKIEQAALVQQSRQLQSVLPEGVQLITVTKNQLFDDIRQAQAAGISVIGENRVQELLKKQEHFGTSLEYHLIGHLQTNKVKYAVPVCRLIHSVDSIRLVEEINRIALKHNKRQNILLEVNVAGEDSKFGISLEQVTSLVQDLQQYPQVCLQGLMTVAPHIDPKKVRPIFQQLYCLFCEVKAKLNSPEFRYLSMGMSNDYTVAIEEGANMVRVGTAIFGPRDYNKIV